jgi:hypothetical protein
MVNIEAVQAGVKKHLAISSQGSPDSPFENFEG